MSNYKSRFQLLRESIQDQNKKDDRKKTSIFGKTVIVNKELIDDFKMVFDEIGQKSLFQEKEFINLFKMITEYAKVIKKEKE